MARIRSIKPEFWIDRKLARQLSRDERMLYIGLWNHADEHARAQGDARVIQGQIFPYESDLTVAKIDLMLDHLEEAKVIHRYVVDSDPYLFLPKLSEHQRLEPSRVRSKIPAPPAVSVAFENGADTPAAGSDSVQDFADKSAPGDNPHSLLYVAGSMEHGAGANGAHAPALAPPPRCPKHLNEPNPPPCRPCGDTRVKREAWDRDQVEAAKREASEAAKQRAKFIQDAIDECGLCDDRGYFGTTVCNHDPNIVDTAKRGMAQVRAVLAKAAQEKP